MGGGIVLRVENLSVWFPLRRGLIEVLRFRPRRYVYAVNNVSFALREGEVFCLVGESGCGKTTTGRALLGLVKPTGGRILYRPSRELAERLGELGVVFEDGFVDLVSLGRREWRLVRREIQVVYQDPYSSLNPRFTVKRSVEEPLIIHGIGDEEWRDRRVREMLEAVRLLPVSEYLERYPHELSGGQRQRVAIARAFILNPRLVVADEPVSMLDVSIRAEILELLVSLKSRLGTTIVFITHDLATARYVCDRIAVMYLGSIVEVGDAEKVIREPLHPYTRALIAAIPEPDPANRRRMRELPIKGEVPSAVDLPRGCSFMPRCVVYDRADPRIKRLCEERRPGLARVARDHWVACWAVS
ncbi:MAG: peptide ABC transporter ATP-binding protein [Hyperthermus sp.]|nr:MAG: peptide ABC transporter ATP-binding protein [Hyperthermus sp.]